MTNKHKGKMQTSTVIWELWIKTTMKFHSTPIHKGIIIKDKPNCCLIKINPTGCGLGSTTIYLVTIPQVLGEVREGKRRSFHLGLTLTIPYLRQWHWWNSDIQSVWQTRLQIYTQQYVSKCILVHKMEILSFFTICTFHKFLDPSYNYWILLWMKHTWQISYFKKW